MFFTIENVLSGADLINVRRWIQGANFVDGKATANVSSDIKHNLEMEVAEPYARIMEILDRSVDSCEPITQRVFPRWRTAPIINRFDTGMYYREHVDFPIQGARTQFGRAPGRFGQNFIRTDYSMTIFLADPQTYDGGELQLQIGERQEFVKLPAGSAVCYQTGIAHAVRPVTRGSRVCAVYWFQSMIQDMNVRRALWNLRNIERELSQSGFDQWAEDTKTVRANLIRYLAQI